MQLHFFSRHQTLSMVLLTSSLFFRFGGIKAQKSAPPIGKTNFAYDANLEKRTNNFVTRVHLLYDRGKYRAEIVFPGTPPTKTPMYMELCDGNSPYIAWSCNLESKTAWPLPESCYYALSRAVKREGVAAARQRYHVSPNYPMPILGGDSEAPRTSSSLKTKADFPALGPRPVGQEIVAGYQCDIYESQTAQNVETSRDGIPGNRIIRQTEHVRAWVEPRTGLVLRLSVGNQPAPGSPMPPTSNGYVVTKLKLPASIPIERFQLPPGVTANVAEIFDDVKLPPGVKRVRAAGKAAYIGMIIE